MIRWDLDSHLNHALIWRHRDQRSIWIALPDHLSPHATAVRLRALGSSPVEVSWGDGVVLTMHDADDWTVTRVLGGKVAA